MQMEAFSMQGIESILHYLWPADLSKDFSHLIVSMFILSQYFFQ